MLLFKSFNKASYAFSKLLPGGRQVVEYATSPSNRMAGHSHVSMGVMSDTSQKVSQPHQRSVCVDAHRKVHS